MAGFLAVFIIIIVLLVIVEVARLRMTLERLAIVDGIATAVASDVIMPRQLIELTSTLAISV